MSLPLFFNLSSSAQGLQPSLPFTGKGFTPLTSIFIFGILQGLELRDESRYVRKCPPPPPPATSESAQTTLTDAPSRLSVLKAGLRHLHF